MKKYEEPFRSEDMGIFGKDILSLHEDYGHSPCSMFVEETADPGSHMFARHNQIALLARVLPHSVVD